MNKKYIISLDLDDTLLNYQKKVTSKTKSYLKKLHDEGHIITIASGRIFDSCYEVISKMNFINYMITDSGSLIYDIKQHQNIYNRKISKKNMKLLFNLYDDNFEYIEFSDEHYYYKYSTKEIKHYGLSKSITNISMFLKNNNAIHATIKLIDYNKNYEIINKINKEFKTLYAFEMKNADSDIKWIEIVQRKVSKFQAIKYIAKKEKINIKNTISFGDNYNDFDMLEKSQYGVAMGNAVKELKERTKYTTKSCNEDGIEYFLRGIFK